MGHKDDKIKKLEKRIKELEKARGTDASDDYKSKIDSNSWNMIEELGKAVMETVKLSRKREWSWIKNWDCKYINLRIDMRDGGAILVNRAGKRISPDQLKYQYNYLEESEDDVLEGS